MKRFVFKFESLLKTLVNKEETKKKEFGAANRKRFVEEKRLLDFSKEYEAYQEKEYRLRGATSDIGHLRDFISYMFKLKSDIYTQKNVLHRAVEFADKKRIELLNATKKKKAIEKLKENKINEYKEYLKKEDAKFTDELCTSRYGKTLTI